MTRNELMGTLLSLGFDILPESSPEEAAYRREGITVKVRDDRIILQKNGRMELLFLDCLCVVNGNLCRTLGWVPTGIENMKRQPTICLIESVRRDSNIARLRRADIEQTAAMLADMISELGKTHTEDPFSEDRIREWLVREA